jgi:L-fuconolactonase
MRLDAHQHFWRFSPEEYGWIGPDMPVLKQNHLPEDLAPLLQEANLDGTVAIQARQTLAETQWLLDLADQYTFIRGVVGWVDLRGADLHSQLERFTAHPKFCGVRHVVQDEPDDRFMLRNDFLRGIAVLGEFELTYDILIYPRHLPVAKEMAGRFPDQPFVLDHKGKPRIRDGLLEPWASDIRRLAAYTNVTCKVSGMVTEADWLDWKPSDFQPYLDVVLEAFGPGRLMFGSDWPVCSLAATYDNVVGLVSAFAQQLTADEQAEVWGRTASRFYGLE